MDKEMLAESEAQETRAQDFLLCLLTDSFVKTSHLLAQQCGEYL